MNSCSWVDEALPGTSVATRSRELIALYSDLDAAVDLTRASGELRCPDGCGKCCEHFDPPVTTVEAELVALHVATGRASPRRASGLGEAGRCAFYDPDASLHCSVYPARPLVCRSFGFTATADKNGRPRFAYCRHMPSRTARHLTGARLAAAFPSMPPVVESLGIRILVLAGQSEAGKQPLSRAVEDALRKIRTLIDLASRSS